jgi:polyhydroxyalkanoate synthesis regulator phasin
MKHRIAAIGVTAGVLGGAAAGLAFGVPAIAGAQESPVTVETTVPAPTDDTGATTDRSAWMQEALAPLVEEGTITQSQADAVVGALEAAKPERGGRGHGGRIGAGLDAAATAIGVTEDELRQALQDGKSIADVAAEKNVDVQEVIDALVADAKTRLDEAVDEGRLTQAEADEQLADVTERITAMVNGELPAGGRGMGGRHGHGPGHHGDGADDDTTSTTTG